MLCTNTMHKVADAIEAAVRSRCCTSATPRPPRLGGGGDPVGLLATGVHDGAALLPRPAGRARPHVLVPGADGPGAVHGIIYDELCLGVVRTESRQAYREVIAGWSPGAEGIIFGCTEIELLVDQADSACRSSRPRGCTSRRRSRRRPGR